MSRKHFIAIADGIRRAGLTQEQTLAVARSVAEHLEVVAPEFRIDDFLAFATATGLD